MRQGAVLLAIASGIVRDFDRRQYCVEVDEGGDGSP
jgi:hypothetical protein